MLKGNDIHLSLRNKCSLAKGESEVCTDPYVVQRNRDFVEKSSSLASA